MLCEWKHSVTPRLFHILHKIEGLHGSRFHLCRADETKVTESRSTPQLLMFPDEQTDGGRSWCCARPGAEANRAQQPLRTRQREYEKSVVT